MRTIKTLEDNGNSIRGVMVRVGRGFFPEQQKVGLSADSDARMVSHATELGVYLENPLDKERPDGPYDPASLIVI